MIGEALAGTTWIDVAMRALEILGIVAIPLALYLRSKATSAETERDVVIKGVEKTKHNAEIKHRIQVEAEKRGVEGKLRETVHRVTGRVK